MELVPAKLIGRLDGGDSIDHHMRRRCGLFQLFLAFLHLVPALTLMQLDDMIPMGNRCFRFYICRWPQFSSACFLLSLSIKRVFKFMAFKHVSEVKPLGGQI